MTNVLTTLVPVLAHNDQAGAPPSSFHPLAASLCSSSVCTALLFLMEQRTEFSVARYRISVALSCLFFFSSFAFCISASLLNGQVFASSVSYVLRGPMNHRTMIVSPAPLIRRDALFSDVDGTSL
jgi:hypothetical protein